MSDLASFHDEVFPAAVSFGATGGPERRNEIVSLTSGREKRNLRFSQSRHRYDAGTGVRSLDDMHAVVAFFEARRGSLHAFRFRDPFDMKSCRPGEAPSPLDQEQGVGDGTKARFPLVKTYGTGSEAYRRLIAKPDVATLSIAVAGVELPSATGFRFDDASGEVVFAPSAIPGPGAVITAGFEFHVPVRFDIEHLALSLSAFNAGQIPSIPLVEVRL